MKIARIAFVLALSLGVLSGPTPAQEPVDEAAGAQEVTAAETPAGSDQEGSSEEAFFESVDVNVVNVEVYVTDKKGNPITGLTKDDFVVTEDGRVVTITNFYVMEDGLPAGPSAENAVMSEPIPGREPMPLIPEEQRLNLILYIDNFNIRPFNRNRMLDDVRLFLHDHVKVGDRVMVVSYDRSLKVRQPFTTDPNLVSSALMDLEKLTGHAVHQDSERREILRAINEADSIGEVEWRVRQFAESQYNDLQFSIDGLRELVDSLAGLEGRKAVLYVSDGLAMTPGEDLFHALTQKFFASSVLTRANDYRATRQFQQLVAAANSNRITFYTIDAAGLRAPSSALADRGSISTAGFDTLVDSVFISNMQSTIRMMAEETGGFAIFNTNDATEGLDRMASDFRTYYSLGYDSPAADDGRYHRIKVELTEKRKDWRIRHREGFRGKSRFDRMADGTTSTLLYGFERNPLEVALRFGAGTPSEGNYRVPVRVDVPLGRIVLVPREEFHQGRLRIYFSALDEKGRMSDVQEVPLDIRIPNEEIETARTKSWTYIVQLEMRSGDQRVAVGVRDELGAVESFVSKSVRVGAG